MRAAYGQYTRLGLGLAATRSRTLLQTDAFRTERDPLGELDVPADAYYGVQTARAVENFPISGLRAPADLVTATILVKKAAAEANAALGRLDARRRATRSSRPPTRSSPASCAISSSSTSIRRAPARRTT